MKKSLIFSLMLMTANCARGDFCDVYSAPTLAPDAARALITLDRAAAATIAANKKYSQSYCE